MGLGQGSGARAGRRHGAASESGYAMAALLVGMTVMAVLMSMALPVWSQYARREREEELIWRGQQYARAVGLFQRKFANTYPPTVDLLLEQRFLRKKYKDPITNDDFQLIPVGGMPPGGQTPGGMQPSLTPPGGTATRPPTGGVAGGAMQPALGIQGVVSKSKDTSIKIYNGRTKYNEWTFVAVATSQVFGGGGNPQQPQGPGQGPGQGRGGPFGGGPGGRPPLPGQGQPPTGVPRQPNGMGQQPPFGQQPFGQPPFGQPPTQPSPFGQPQPFGQPPGGRPPVPGGQRPPG